MKIVDVDKMVDLPYLSQFANSFWSLVFYDVGDKTAIYEYRDDKGVKWTIDVISNQGLISPTESFADLFAIDEIYYFSLSKIDLTNRIFEQYNYRPLVNNAD